MEDKQVTEQQPNTSDTQTIPLLRCPKCETRFPQIFLEPSSNEMNIIVHCCCVKDSNPSSNQTGLIITVGEYDEDKHYVMSLTQFLNDLRKKHKCHRHEDKEGVKYLYSEWYCLECAKKETKVYDYSVNFSCDYHYMKPFIHYCKKCKKSVCDTCYDKDHLDHNVKPMPQINYVEPNPNCFAEFKAKNRKLIDEFIAKLNLDDDKHKQMKTEILSVCETNEAINEQLKQLSQIISKTFELGKTFPISEMTTFCHLLINNVEYKQKERTLDKEFASLRKYLQKNYVLKQKHLGRRVKKINIHSSWVNDLIQLKDKRIISCSNDKTIKLWNPDTYECIAVLKGHTKGVTGLLLLKDGRLASCSEEGIIKIWDLNTNQCVATSEDDLFQCQCIIQLTDGRLGCCPKSSKLEIWDLDTLKRVVQLEGHRYECYQIIQLFDGRLASCSCDKTAKIWDVSTYKCIKTLRGHDESVHCIIQLKDSRLATGSYDNSVKIWDSTTYKCLATLKGKSWIYSLFEMTDGRLVSGDNTNALITYDTTTYKRLTIKKRADFSMMTHVYQLENGYVVACSSNGYIAIWDL